VNQRLFWFLFAISTAMMLAINVMGNVILHHVPQLVITFDPPTPSLSSDASGSTVVSAVNVTWSNGAPFTGTIAFTTPFSDDSSTFALSGNNVIVNPDGPGLGADGDTTQMVSIVATQ
jgi:hypothetical protein